MMKLSTEFFSTLSYLPRHCGTLFKVAQVISMINSYTKVNYLPFYGKFN
jgi:hypothetical protein